jgi:alpha-N-arabinofuranosidase
MIDIPYILIGLTLLCACGVRAESDLSAFYTYRQTGEDVTRVEVGAAQADAPRISPRVFSNFLEHLGGSIYEGLWANAVYNPQFEADAQGNLARWSLQDDAAWLEEGLSGRSLRLPPGGEARQITSLPVHRERRYRGTVWTRVLGGKAAAVEISLRHPDRPEVLCRALARAEGPDWKARRFAFIVPENAVARGQTVELRVTGLRGEAGVDMLELFPGDAADGMDPDVVRIAKGLKIELLRWPGGNFASGYHWRSGIGPREKRPTIPNPAWSGLETHHFGTDEFMKFCRRIGAKPHVCVNAGNGSPEEAAAWVAYCNGGAETPMGRLRAANGHPEPYNIRVWEIGNELYGGWQIGHTDAPGNAARFVRFRDAMLAADPSIEIIATGKGDQYTGGGLESDRQWNAAALDAARSSPPEYLSLHPLVSLPGGLAPTYNFEEIYESAMAHPQWWAETFAPQLQRLVRERLGPGAPTRAAVTEWGIILGGRDWLRYPNHDVQSGAVYAALFYHALFRAGEFAGLANVTALMHGGSIKRHNSIVYVTPMIHVQRMYGAARPSFLLPTRVSGPGYDVPERGFLPDVRGVPWLDAQAAAKRGARFLFVVNRDPQRARRAEFVLPFAPKEAEIETLAAAPQEGNSAAHPGAVAPVRTALKIAGRSFTHDFPPCSVSTLRLR